MSTEGQTPQPSPSAPDPAPGSMRDPALDQPSETVDGQTADQTPLPAADSSPDSPPNSLPPSRDGADAATGPESGVENSPATDAAADSTPGQASGLTPGLAPGLNVGGRQQGTTFVPTRPVRDNPRRVRDGIRLKQVDAIHAGEGPWLAPWMTRLQQLVHEDERILGLEYARAGQVATMDVQDGGVIATVQGRAAQPYKTRISIEVLEASHWESLIQLMAAETGLVATLLTDDIPAELERFFEQQGIPMVPHFESDAVSCTCSIEEPCRHIAALWMLVAQSLYRDPSVVMHMRGLDRVRLVERLRQVRAIHTRGVAAAHADPLIPESRDEALPLEECVDGFWRIGPGMHRLSDAPRQYASQALLRRLGPSPLNGKFPLVGLLASVFETVGNDALQLRDRAEHLDAPAGDE